MSTSDATLIVIGAVLVAVAAALAVLPLVRRPADASYEAAEPAVDRFRLYRQVLELEFDQHMGKLSMDDYQTLAGDLLSRASLSLRSEQQGLQAVEAQIEREIAEARRALANTRRTSSVVGETAVRS